MAVVTKSLVSSLSTASSLDSFLQGLLGDGRISSFEYSTAISLLQQQDKRSRQQHLPGAVTLAYSALPANQLATVSAVFNTVELIEQILSHLDYKDLLSGVARTCHGFRDIVNAAPALRKKLFVQPDQSSTLYTPTIRNIHYTITYQYLEILIIDAEAVLNSSATLRQMLLSQPPPTSLQVFYDCSCRSRDAGTLVAEDGLRFSHVAERLSKHFKASKALQSSYKPCPCETYKEARLILKHPLLE